MAIDYGKAFRVVRAARGMTQTDVATKAKTRGNYLSLLESGDRVPSTDMVEELAKALRISKSLLYYWETGERRMPDEYRERIRRFLLTRSTLAG